MTPTVISYIAGISACEKGGQWEQALVLHDDMCNSDMTRDDIIHIAGMSACEKGRALGAGAGAA